MPETEHGNPIDRREAIRQVTVLLGGVALAGGSSLVAACERAQRGVGAAGAGGAGGGALQAAGGALARRGGGEVLAQTQNPGGKAAHRGSLLAVMGTRTLGSPQAPDFRP